MDVCSPVTAGTERPAVLLIHGGGWARGDKGTTAYHAVCEWLAAEGFVTFSADYSLGEPGRFPVAPNELRSAIAWMRTPATTVRYGFDPARIGLVGGSAGGSLAALLATEGSGPTDRGTRVAALVDLSGPVDLTANGQSLGHPGAGLQSLVLGYLGCASFANCRQASAASAITHVDSSDPPAFIQGSERDFVPHEQGQAFAAALERVGVPTRMRIVPGDRHSIAELDAASRAAVAAFLHRYLG
nr:alpha/beta hydrolase [Planctomonas sp. JC2975]